MTEQELETTDFQLDGHTIDEKVMAIHYIGLTAEAESPVAQEWYRQSDIAVGMAMAYSMGHIEITESGVEFIDDSLLPFLKSYDISLTEWINRFEELLEDDSEDDE